MCCNQMETSTQFCQKSVCQSVTNFLQNSCWQPNEAIDDQFFSDNNLGSSDGDYSVMSTSRQHWLATHRWLTTVPNSNYRNY